MRDFQLIKSGFFISQGLDDDGVDDEGVDKNKPKSKSKAEILNDFDVLNADYLENKNGSKA